jgi:hypothetical protein
MANPEHVEVVKRGAEAIRKWREENPDVRFDLSDADFRGETLSGVDLRNANLSKTDLDGTDLSGANLSNASLFFASIADTNLSEAILEGAALWGAIFHKADLCHTVFHDAHVDGTVFADVDFSAARSLETASFSGRSTVGIDTFYKSKGKIPEAFLRGCGLQPWEVLAAKLYDPNLTPSQAADIQNHVFQERFKGYFLSGIFISYSHQDSEFVVKIHERLEREGASVWLDRHDLVAGPLQKQVFQGIRLNDVVLLVLSESSLKSDWVENELDLARSKEKEQNRAVLCPVALDDCWKAKVQDKNADDRHLWRTLTKKNILDFSGWRSDGFEEPFTKLLDGIKRYYGAADGSGK